MLEFRISKEYGYIKTFEIERKHVTCQNEHNLVVIGFNREVRDSNSHPIFCRTDKKEKTFETFKRERKNVSPKSYFQWIILP